MKALRLIFATLCLLCMPLGTQQSFAQTNHARQQNALPALKKSSHTLETQKIYDAALDLLLAENYTALHPMMIEASKSPAPLYTGYRPIYSYAKSWIHSPRTNATQLVQKLHSWSQYAPDSALPHTILGIVHNTYAYNGLTQALHTNNSPPSIISDHLKAATKAFKQAVKLNNNQLLAWAGLIEISAYNAQQDKPLLRLALEKMPQNYWIQRAIMITRLEKFQGSHESEAVNYAKMAAREAPAGSPIYGLVIEAHWETSLWIAYKIERMTQGKVNYTVKDYLSKTRVQREIQESLKRSLANNPYNVRLLTLAAELADRTQNYTLAEQYYKQAVAIDPYYKRFEDEKPYNLLRLADIAQTNNKAAHAQAYLKHYLKAYPNDQEVIKTVEKLKTNKSTDHQ